MTDSLTENRSYPLGDSEANVALRYATGATHGIIGPNSVGPTSFDNRGIGVKQ